MREEKKMQKSLYGFPIKIDYRCPPDKIYFLKNEWIFPRRLKITKELKLQLKSLLNLTAKSREPNL